MAVYFYGMIRILPHFQSIFQSYSTISVNFNAFLIIQNLLKRDQKNTQILKKTKLNQNEFNKIIIKNVKFSYDTVKTFNF